MGSKHVCTQEKGKTINTVLWLSIQDPEMKTVERENPELKSFKINEVTKENKNIYYTNPKAKKLINWSDNRNAPRKRFTAIRRKTCFFGNFRKYFSIRHSKFIKRDLLLKWKVCHQFFYFPETILITFHTSCHRLESSGIFLLNGKHPAFKLGIKTMLNTWAGLSKSRLNG